MLEDIVEIQDLYDTFSKKDDFWRKKIEIKKFLIFYLKDLKFYKHICKMYILVDIWGNCKKSRFIYEERRFKKKRFYVL